LAKSMKRRPVVRMASPETELLRSIIFRRYPEHEWATFAKFGWRETKDALVLTLAGLDPPQNGDLNEHVGHIAINEAYTLREALAAEHHRLAVGIIHSHPQECPPIASSIDDDMDGYYAQYFPDFAARRPYVSLIAAIIDNKLALSGRVWWRGEWLRVERFCVECTQVQAWVGTRHQAAQLAARQRTARLNAAFGLEAAVRLRGATVAIIGAGGTGSAAIEVLARAGVGRLIVVDPDQLTESNLERVHGSSQTHTSRRWTKVALAREHVHAIDPTCEVVGLVGSLPQDEVIDAVVTADVLLGCTDQQHSRLAISDLAVRFLVPAIDCGVALEGTDGKVSGQIVQLVRCLSADPCVLCRGMINAQRLGQELMSLEERRQRSAAAQDALARGENPDPYWAGVPQLNTVGYLTTVAGALAAGYAVGWLTGRFDPPFSRLQMNLTAPFLDVTDDQTQARSYCACRRVRGWADQGKVDCFVTAPTHWPPVQRLRRK
jgi:hypothetical protein